MPVKCSAHYLNLKMLFSRAVKQRKDEHRLLYPLPPQNYNLVQRNID